MSEYQFIAFRAVDAPVSQVNMAYMRRQSSRAEITPWSFFNEYHFGDFGGNAKEMLRRGYDVHMQYANFGIRALHIRLPTNLPNHAAAKRYLDEEGFGFIRERSGGGGLLSIEPFHESGDLDELMDPAELFERLVPLRAEILAGDLRPLYLAHLAVCCDGNHDPDETVEAPVPTGLDSLTPAQQALAEYYGLDDALIAAAAQAGGKAPAAPDTRAAHAQWIARQPQPAKDAWLVELMGDSHQGLRSRILAQCTGNRPAPAWPTTQPGRTVVQLKSIAQQLRDKTRRRTKPDSR